MTDRTQVLAALLVTSLAVTVSGQTPPSHAAPARRPRPAAATSARPPNPVAVVPPTVATTERVPQPTPTLDLAEVIPVPVSNVDGMLRRMRVFLFNAPAASSAYGLGGLGQGRRIWALLPSCRPANPDDPREQCPVDRVSFEAVIRGNVGSTSPTFLGGAPDGRRVQSYVVEANVPRVRIRVVGPASRIRYEAVVEAEHLADLPSPEGAPSADGFAFDLTAYPAR